MKKYFSDEIGKIIVILILAPIILFKAFLYQDLTLGVVGVLLFIYDFFWYYKYKNAQPEDILESDKNMEQDKKFDNQFDKIDKDKSEDIIMSEEVVEKTTI